MQSTVPTGGQKGFNCLVMREPARAKDEVRVEEIRRDISICYRRSCFNRACEQRMPLEFLCKKVS